MADVDSVSAAHAGRGQRGNVGSWQPEDRGIHTESRRARRTGGKTGLRVVDSGDRMTSMFDWSDCSEVTASPETVSGAFVFRGTRVPVKALFENLEDGATVDDFLQWFPGVGREQVDAVLEFTAHSLEPAVAG